MKNEIQRSYHMHTGLQTNMLGSTKFLFLYFTPKNEIF